MKVSRSDPESRAGVASAKRPEKRRRGWLRDRPWLWIALLYILVVAVNVVFLVIANRNSPVDVG